MRKRKARPQRRDVPEFSKLDIAMSSTTKPMPVWWREEMLANMRRGLESMRAAPDPTVLDWQCVADSVNLIDGMERLGWIDDIDAARAEAEAALAEAGERYKAGKSLRLSGPGLAACEGLIDAFEEVVSIISERNMKTAVVETARRLRAILKTTKGATI